MNINIQIPESLDSSILQITEHKTNIKNPWIVRKSKTWTFNTKDKLQDHTDEITLLSDIQLDCQNNLDTIVCCLIIGGMLLHEPHLPVYTFKRDDIRFFENLMSICVQARVFLKSLKIFPYFHASRMIGTYLSMHWDDMKLFK